MYIRSKNNVIEYSEITNNLGIGIRMYSDYSGGYSSVKITDSKIKYNYNSGIYAINAYIGLEYSELSNNGADGLQLRDTRLGYPYNGASYFRGNLIRDNGSNAVQVHYNSTVYDGYYYTKGNNDIKSNSSHEIVLSSSSARWWDAVGGSYTAISENTTSTSTKYVYNLAQTLSGESYVSWRVGMENNAWDYRAPSSNKFYGNVDYYPYQVNQMFSSSGPRFYDPPIIIFEANEESTTLNNNVQSSVSLNKSLATLTTDEEKDMFLEAKNNIQTLKSEILEDPNSIFIPQKLNGLTGYYNELPASLKKNYSEVPLLVKEFQNDQHLAGTVGSFRVGERLTSETALMLEAHQNYTDGNYDYALELVKKYKKITINIDIKREMGLIEAAALEKLGSYKKAIKVYKKLAILSKRGIDSKNSEYDYKDEIESLVGLIIERDGTYEEEIGSGATKVKEMSEKTPTAFKLNEAYPNPFNPSTLITFDLPEAGFVEVSVYDIGGRLISTLTNQSYQAGTHSLSFDASNLASGIYLVRADLSGSLQTQKITLVK